MCRLFVAANLIFDEKGLKKSRLEICPKFKITPKTQFFLYLKIDFRYSICTQFSALKTKLNQLEKYYMRRNQLRNLTVILVLTFLSILIPVRITAQCGGTYFKPTTTGVVPINGFYVHASDMDGDGFTDLVGYSETSLQGFRGQVIISPGNGNSGFGTPVTINAPAGFNISNIIVGDYDADNLKDIVVRFNLPSQTLQVYRNNGNLTFSAAPLRSPAESIFMIDMLDINNDGKGDLISLAGTTYRYHLGVGDGTFQAPVNFANGLSMKPADFNSDGKPDLITESALYINQGGGAFTTIPNVLTLGGFERVHDVRDYNGDGKPDVVTLLIATPGILSIHMNLGNNTFQRTSYPIDFGGGGFDTGNAKLLFGNFGGNAAPDIINSAPIYKKVMLFTNDGAGVFSGQIFNYNYNGSFTGEFNADGKTDAVVVSDGNRFSESRRKLFDEISLTVLNNVCSRFGQTKIVDFDRSGQTDFSFWTPANGVWNYSPGINGSFPQIAVNWGLGSLGDIPTPGDFDGDGATDLAVFRNSTGVWWINRSSDFQVFTLPFGLPGDKPAVGDFDGDRISDIAVWRPSDGNWYIYFMGTGQFAAGHWGLDGDKPMPEDYDGDGKTDLAVYRPSTGVWYFLRSSDQSFGAVNFGISTDRPVPADYDGDGKADIAVYRNSGTVLYVFRSYNFATAAFIFGSFGGSQIIPQPGDYNGDFVWDIGGYDPSIQSWRVYGPYQIIFGATNAIPAASMVRIE